MIKWLVVLAGGVGSRFWPLSTPTAPKQLLPLVSDQPLLRDTLDRLAPLAAPQHTLILTNAALVDPIRALAPEIPAENLIAEPRPIGTAGALAWAACEVLRRGGPDATMISVHADWSIGDPRAFRSALLRAAEIATQSRMLLTVGVVPSRPDPGFGYIEPGEQGENGAALVKAFIEKPDRRRAAELVRAGCLWNSGIFVWNVQVFLNEVATHTPEVANAVASASLGIEHFFSTVKSVSVDVGVLERSQNVMVLPGSFGWDDVGTWDALHRVRALDSAGNASSGSVWPVDAKSNVVHATGTDVVLYGVNNLVVVALPGLTLVTTRDRAADLKTLIEQLPPRLTNR